MRIYLVQHGRPVSKEEDPDRPLSDPGSKDVVKIAQFLEKCDILVDEIIHSGKTRARQTAEIISSRIKSGYEPRQMEGLSPLDDPGYIADEIIARGKDVMLVGHLPHLAKLTSHLLTGNESTNIARFRQGGVVCLSRMEGEEWAIDWMIVPDII